MPLKENQNLVTIIGIGNGGQNIINYLNERIENTNFISVNYDEEILKRSKTKTILYKNNTAILLTEDSKTIVQIDNMPEIIDAEKIILVSAFGGNFGTTTTIGFAEYLKLKNKQTFAFVTLPFEFEGDRRKNTALSGIEELKKYVENVVVFDNETLTQNLPKDITVREMFDTINEKIFADMQTVLYPKH